MKTTLELPKHIKAWIDTKPYLLHGATWFAWHNPTNRANNSGNSYSSRTLANPFPGMSYFLLGSKGWEMVIFS